MAILVWDGKITDDEMKKISTEIPISRIELPNGKTINVHRCETDGAIVTNDQDSLQYHLGHKLKQPTLLQKEELINLIERHTNDKIRSD